MSETGGTPWLTVQEGDAPLLLTMPHTGTTVPAAIEQERHSRCGAMRRAFATIPL